MLGVVASLDSAPVVELPVVEVSLDEPGSLPVSDGVTALFEVQPPTTSARTPRADTDPVAQHHEPKVRQSIAATIPRSRTDDGLQTIAMIERVVLVKLAPEHRSPEALAAIVKTTTQTLLGAAGVRTLRVATAADGRTRKDWDLCIEVVFDDIEAVERYRTDPVHRAYADVFLEPLMTKIHVFNFERHFLGEPPPTG